VCSTNTKATFAVCVDVENLMFLPIKPNRLATFAETEKATVETREKI